MDGMGDLKRVSINSDMNVFVQLGVSASKVGGHLHLGRLYTASISVGFGEGGGRSDLLEALQGEAGEREGVALLLGGVG